MRLWCNIEILAAFTQQKLIHLRKHLLLLYSVIVLYGISFQKEITYAQPEGFPVWAIIGSASDPGARPIMQEWVTDIRESVLERRSSTDSVTDRFARTRTDLSACVRESAMKSV